MRIMSGNAKIIDNTVSIDVSVNSKLGKSASNTAQMAGLVNIAVWLPSKEFSTLMRMALFLFEENKKNYAKFLASKEETPEIVVATSED